MSCVRSIGLLIPHLLSVTVVSTDEEDTVNLLNSLDSTTNACIDTLNAGIMTKDLALLADDDGMIQVVDSEEFLKAIRERI